MDFKDIILHERTKQNLSQKQLADKAGVLQSLVARCETGSEPRFSAGIKLLNALNYDFSKLRKPSYDMIQDTVDKLNLHLKEMFDVKIIKRTISPKVLDGNNKTVSYPIILFVAVSNFKIGKFSFSKGDTIELIESEIYELNQKILQEQNAIMHECVTGVTKTEFEHILKSDYMTGQIFCKENYNIDSSEALMVMLDKLNNSYDKQDVINAIDLPSVRNNETIKEKPLSFSLFPNAVYGEIIPSREEVVITDILYTDNDKSGKLEEQ